MVDQLSPWLAFDEEYVVSQFKQNLAAHYVRSASENENKPQQDQKEVWGWGQGVINESLKFPTSLAGSTTRRPGRYLQLDFKTGKPDPKTPELLTDTNEYIHASVRARKDLNGLDATNQKPYGTPPALTNWTLTKDVKDGKVLASWKYLNPADPKDLANGRVLQEAPIGRLESRLLDEDAKTKAALFNSPGTSVSGSDSTV
jgi:hypothetical protein